MTTAENIKILLVEDDEAIAASIIYAIQREKFSVLHCLTGITAEDQLTLDNFSLAILDVGLPDQSGFELCRKLHASQPNLPIMFLTAHSDEIDRIVGLELGAEDYLCKPFSPRELVLRIKTILRRNHTTASNAHQNQILVHESDRKQFRFRGIDLTLTRSEYILLSTLLRQPGRVFSRDNLLTILGDVSENSGDRAIDTHIKELRAKFRAIDNLKGVDDSQEIISTHRGLGYSLNDKSLL